MLCRHAQVQNRHPDTCQDCLNKISARQNHDAVLFYKWKKAMRRCIIWLAMVGLVCASPNVFNVDDDFLAFPQYEIIFSHTFISDKDAQSRLAYAASSSSARAHATPLSDEIIAHADRAPPELARPWDSSHSSTNGDSEFELDRSTEFYESMILDGKPYLCAIPVVENPAQNQTAFAQAKAKAEKEEAAELTRATARGLELLKDMEGSCMYFISGWWSYSFCYNTQVKQFHQLPPGKDTPVYPPVEDKSTPSYILGRFDKKEGRNTGHQQGKESHDTVALGEMQAKGESRYLVQRLGGGTLCDLTGRPRRVEVQFHCYPQSGDRIGWIKEVATCSYVMVIYTQRLCNDVAFLPPRETKANAITCRQIVKESDIADWQQSQHPTFPPTYRDPKFVSSGSSRPVVAGIEVGGMVQVGKPGARLEAPKIFVQADGAIMAMGDSTNSRFLAKQEAADKGGKLEKVSDEEVREIGLDPKDVAEVRQRLKKYANGKAWRLDAIEGPDGINFRGIFEGVDEDAGMSYDRPAARQDDERRGADADGAEDEGEGEEGEEEERRGSLEDLKDEL